MIGPAFAPLAVFVTVTLLMTLSTPVRTSPKATVVADSDAVPCVPRPLSANVCGLLAALSAKRSEALLLPLLVGVKVTSTWQLAPGATDWPAQPLELIENWFAFVPVSVTEPAANVSGWPPANASESFVIVNVCVALLPSTTLPNGPVAGVPLKPGAVT